MHDDDSSDHSHGGVGHNHASPEVAQWQTPHAPEKTVAPPKDGAEPDIDLVETSFIESFALTNDPTSFLRLAGVPFVAVDPSSEQRLCLLRVAIDDQTDVGSVTPHLGGSSYRYDPLPAKFVSRRRKLRFVYHDGKAIRELTFTEARRLVEEV